jgi:hypothetical protein
MRLIAYIYDPVDVGILSNTTERTFPLEALLDMYIYLAMDISSDFQLDQTLWQGMVTGEEVAVNRKFKTRKSLEWKSPGALAGNQLPPWTDNAGSISRRMIIFAFHTRVTKVDPSLMGTLAYALKQCFTRVCRARQARDPRLFEKGGVCVPRCRLQMGSCGDLETVAALL